MSLITVVIVLFIVGVGLCLINVYAAKILDSKIRLIINIVVIIAVLIWLMQAFGVWKHVDDIKVNQVKLFQAA